MALIIQTTIAGIFAISFIIQISIACITAVIFLTSMLLDISLDTGVSVMWQVTTNFKT